MSFATRVVTPIYDHAHSNTFQSTFNFNVFVSKYKISDFSSFSSGDIIDLKIHLIGQEHFDSHLRNQNFVKHEMCVSLQQLIKTFIIDQIEIKLMTNFFYRFKEP